MAKKTMAEFKAEARSQILAEQAAKEKPKERILIIVQAESHEQKEGIRKAAKAAGQSMSEFVLTAAVTKANQ